jgi:DNA-binding CsgD family transcriptional regulator
MTPPGPPAEDHGPVRPALSHRERDVLVLVAEGLTNPEIGRRLYLSHHTVKEYLSSAMRKLGVSTRVGAVLAAADGGLIARLGNVGPRVAESGVLALDVEPGSAEPLPGLGADISIQVLKVRLNLSLSDAPGGGKGLEKTSIADHRSKGP